MPFFCAIIIALSTAGITATLLCTSSSNSANERLDNLGNSSKEHEAISSEIRERHVYCPIVLRLLAIFLTDSLLDLIVSLAHIFITKKARKIRLLIF